MRWLPAGVLALCCLIPVPAGAQDFACAVPASVEAPATPEALQELRRFSTGRGVRVAVIDTGVAPHPELRVRPGADYVSGDPFLDCDSHGTVVAGIIGGATLGIAPGAEIISVRQTSAHYREVDGGNLQTLTDAIHNALDEGARVLNVSVVSCVEPALAERIDASGLTAALHRAEREGAVVVAAAGNLSADCEPGFTVFPAEYPTVLAVGARADSHTLAQYSMAADLSANGHVERALSSRGNGWAAGTHASDGVRPYEGTSFAAPVVSGSVALLLSRSPHLSPAQVRELVHAAAQPGGGAVNPMAVVTQLPPDDVPVSDPLVIEPAREFDRGARLRMKAVGAAFCLLSMLILLYSQRANQTTVAPSTSRSGQRRG